MQVENRAAWLRTVKSPALAIDSAPYTKPKPGEIVIRNHAVSINPLDGFIQRQGTTFAYQWLQHPVVLGADVAGEVVEVGAGVSIPKVGDRVLGYSLGIEKFRNSHAEGGFQLYVVLLADMTCPLPTTVSYESACTLPLCISTAACALFQKDQLGLAQPSLNPTSTGKTVLIWGGSTSVGCNAIQLAVAAGYEVLTTCSPRNFDMVKRLGASQAFDYKDKTIVASLIQATSGKIMAGAITIGKGGAEACFDVLAKCQGNKFIAMVTYPVPDPTPQRFIVLTTALTYMRGMVTYTIKSKLHGIRFNMVFGSTMVEMGLGKTIFTQFLPEALAQSRYICAPPPRIVGRGLESVQPAIDMHAKGVSAEKLVVVL